ncbi:hypothetical protein [Kribbella kalugense]|uniref:hypothetical protein n=1 Tax=Kribbella kalugense TaxID=2512221 RepID=UPI001066F87D|nr:hypothetical protein [Kribbella kalugense]
MVHAADGYAINLMTTVSAPLAAEDVGIREEIDRILVDGHRSGTRVQSVDTVAGTIFPVDLYVAPGFAFQPGLDSSKTAELDLAAADMYEAYLDILPILRTESANQRGTYFGRMISWPGKTGGGFNQLAERVRVLRHERTLKRSKHNLDDIAVGGEAEGLWGHDVRDGVPAGLQVYAANDRRPRGFPCLVHIDLTVFQGRLSLAAVYRHQYLVTKAYGNLLGLSRLQGFLAQQTGYEVGELVVNATMADLEEGTYTKSGVSDLIEAARAKANS